MATFFTDADAAAAGEFVEPEVLVATEFTIVDSTVTPRWHWPNVAPTVTPQIWIYNAAGTLQNGGNPLPFLTSTLGAWNSCSSLSLGAGTYRVAVNTNRYPAVVGFFSGGPVTRSGITAIQGRFGPTGAAPPSVPGNGSAYLVDLDAVPTGGSGASPTGFSVPVTLGTPATALNRTAAPTGLAVPVAFGTPAAALNRTAAPQALSVPVTFGTPIVGRNGASPTGLAVPVSFGTPAATVARSAAPAGFAVPVTFGTPSTNAPGRAITVRPSTGTTARPNTGITPRP